MSIASPALWMITVGAVLLLLVFDFALTHTPHEVSTREAAGWSAFYLALPLAFAAWIWAAHGSSTGTEFLTGYIVEKSLSVDNLFVFMLLLGAFAVPPAFSQRVLLFGIAGALVLRGVFIAIGAAALHAFTATFLLFGLILLATAVKVLRDARGDQHDVDVSDLRSVRLLRRFFPVTDGYRGPALSVVEDGRRALTPLAVVVVAVLATDVVFAVDSVPAVFGITDDPYLVFATNAFALLGLRALYFLLNSLLRRLVHLGYGLAAILGLIGAKLVLHWAHGIWPAVPEVPTPVSLFSILGILALVTVTSLIATRNGPEGTTTPGPGTSEIDGEVIGEIAPESTRTSGTS
ncbi:MAG: tellurite resistance protein TerC [Actinomycetota bacterium]|nr:tellurite resistance protein TerC [Actinomycetota bacterium]